MLRRSRFLLVLVVSILLVRAWASAQDGLRVDVELVNIVATVTDQAGRYVGNLGVEDFTVEEDGIPQKIAHFTQDHDLPVSVGIVLDTSGSMEGNKIRTARQAVERFIRTIHEDDDIFLMTFSSDAALRQDFTSDRAQLSRALLRIRVSGETALYDGLRDGLSKIRNGQHDKRAILLITDGQDTSSSTGLNEVLRTIWRSELLVYSLGISPMTYGRRGEHVPFSWPLPGILGGSRNRSSQRDTVNMDVLKEFAETSGGRAFLLSESFLAGGSAQMEKVLTQIADELRSQYTLGYYRTTPDDEQFHRLRVRAGRGNTVRARSGYLATVN